MPAPHISGRLLLLRDTVPWATYALKSSHLSRRDALAALGRCNLFGERHDLADCPIYMPSSAEHVESCTSKKAMR